MWRTKIAKIKNTFKKDGIKCNIKKLMIIIKIIMMIVAKCKCEFNADSYNLINSTSTSPSSGIVWHVCTVGCEKKMIQCFYKAL